MPNDRGHAVILVTQRIAGKALADLVEGNDLKSFRQRDEVKISGMRARSRIGAAEIAAIYKDDGLAIAGHVIRSFDSFDVDGLGRRKHDPTGWRGMVVHVRMLAVRQASGTKSV